MTFWAFAAVAAICYTVYLIATEIRKAVVGKARAAAGIADPVEDDEGVFSFSSTTTTS
jgi:hypothetical protein